MLGEKIGEARGQVTGRRVLGGASVETSFATEGTILGVPMQDMGTYTSEMRDDGTLIGEGNGIVMGANGEMATWSGAGVGRFNEDGSLSFRGAIYYYSKTPTFRKLNGFAAIYEHDVDAAGKATNAVWEWK